MTQKQADCNHSTTTQGYWEEEENWYTGEMERKYVYGHEVGTWRDISISQYECTKCGLVFNYSGGNPHHVLEKE